MSYVGRVDFQNDCKLEQVINGHKLYSRWLKHDRVQPTKFPGANKEWVVVFPNGDATMSFTKSGALDLIPRPPE